MKKIKLLGLLFAVTSTYAQSTSENFIQSKTCLNDDCTKKTETVTYFDGLGRPKQVVGVKATTTGKDLVTPVTYDDFGRQTKDILPVPANSLNAAIHTGILNEDAANAYYGTAYAYAEKEIENSPLDRVLQQAQPGDEWRMYAGHTTQFKYQVNAAGEVKKFLTNTTTNTVGAISNTVSSTPTVGIFAPGVLYKNTVIDEDGTPVIQYTNGRGQLLLIRRTDGSQNVDTYYVYNEYGQQVFIIPPKAVQQIEQNNNTVSQHILETLCYQYRYDGKGRQVEKKLPGRGNWESVVYDGADRPILTQDVNLQKQGKWLISKYDRLGRVVYTGMIPGGSRTEMQSQIGDQVINEETVVGGFNADELLVYYTNRFFQNISPVLTVNYYDSYPRDQKEPTPTKILDQFVISSSKYANGGINTLSIPTATYVKNIEDNGWTKNYFYYDTKGRKIGERSWNPLGGYTKKEFKLDFSGKPQESYTYHLRNQGSTLVTIKERFFYDNQNRLLKHYHQVDTQPEELLAENTYNDIGQLINKKTGNTTGSPLQSIDYEYNIRGWLRKVNNPTSGNLFAFELKYEKPEDAASAPARYNGNISEFDWWSAGENRLKRYAYKYDKLDRLKDASYREPYATTPANDGYNEHIAYDLNGNIQTLRRFQKYNNIPLLIDELEYNLYEGNRLKRVLDVSNNNLGYPAGGNLIDYDENGNMTSHLDKGIAEIKYNYLNLPTEVNYTDSDSNVKFIYRADGSKLKKVFSYRHPRSGSILSEITEYLDGFQYLEGSGLNNLRFFPTAEGYYDFEKKRYIYNYEDHLGNIRLAYYRDANNQAVIDREVGYYPFGLEYAAPQLTQNPNYTYGFQGQEKQKETGWSSFKWRNSIPELGRFFNVDPLSEKYAYQSHYNFSENRVVQHVELEGLEGEDFRFRMAMKQNGGVQARAEREDQEAHSKTFMAVIRTVSPVEEIYTLATGRDLEGNQASRKDAAMLLGLNLVPQVKTEVKAGKIVLQAEAKAEGKAASKATSKAKNSSKKPYSKSRPSYGKDQVETVWKNGQQPDNKVYDPNTGEELTWDKSVKPRSWDMGHKPGEEYRKLHKDYMDGKIDKEEFLKRYRDPGNYQPESKSANRSGKYEQR
ncbi:DUF6443 domain-containing protein [Chryseobacterium sp. c4a]|uniref:DUF6443 domain-containing protein n=1 Tax=Chryseobacterium sp. c4a TaxID=1573582 RepID=UPI001358AB4D|nr:DUF6443 domain-containing protein [Chryseobacterium sp. c4a]